MLRFDPKTLTSWKTRDITHVSCEVIDGGCAGQKLLITEDISELCDSTLFTDGITVHARRRDISYFEDAYITHVGNQWILSSEAVNTRCGCGKSFSLKSDNPIQDKIARMKLAMKQKKEGIHLDIDPD
jgi:Fe-S cluster assembly iron-binding protein IscA